LDVPGPYLSSNFGLGIIWAAVLGITFQFFINMEIERYTLAMGESVFVGLARSFGKLAPLWFLFSTFVPWMWPGIMASSASALSRALGFQYSSGFAIGMLILLGILYSLGSVVYKTQETVQKGIILIGVPFIFILTIFFAKPLDYAALAQGIVGKGTDFWFLPLGLPLGTFLTALAYAGAGGNLNLAQSLYIREKGYGMGAYAGKVTTMLSGVKDTISLEGNTFPPTPENLHRFRIWWRRVNIEHATVFLLTGAFTMMLLSLLAYSTVYGNTSISTSISFLFEQARVIGTRTVPFLGTFFLLMAALMLFGTQFSVYGSNARIMVENLCLLSKKLFPTSRIPLLFFALLWIQIGAGIIVFLVGFSEPLALLVVGGILNAVSMFIYTGLMIRLNTTTLHRALRPSGLRLVAITSAFLFYGGFSLFTILQNIQKLL
jgi:hypothetical protein